MIGRSSLIDGDEGDDDPSRQESGLSGRPAVWMINLSNLSLLLVTSRDVRVLFHQEPKRKALAE